MKFCNTCESDMVATRFGDFDVVWHCNCDLTHVEGDGNTPGVSLASLQEDTYDPFEGEDMNSVSLVPALEASLRLCNAEVPEPHLEESASAEVA